MVFGSFMISRPNLGCSHWLEFVYRRMLPWCHFARASNWVKDTTSFLMCAFKNYYKIVFRCGAVETLLHGLCHIWSRVHVKWGSWRLRPKDELCLVWKKGCSCGGTVSIGGILLVSLIALSVPCLAEVNVWIYVLTHSNSKIIDRNKFPQPK